MRAWFKRPSPLAWATILTAFPIMVALQWIPQSTDASTLTTLKVESSTVTKTLSLSGSVTSLNQIAVAYSGSPTTINTVPVSIGQSVAEGQTLATLANGSTLTSPLKGTVVSINVDPGNLVPAQSSGTTSSPSSTTPTRRLFIKSLKYGIRGFVADGPHSEPHFCAKHARVVTNDSKCATTGESIITSLSAAALRGGSDPSLVVRDHSGKR